MTIAAGTRLGRYEIRSPLGAGGMGEVYLAEDTGLERIVALKILPADMASEQERMQRFVQEAKAASALNHPNIITIHEIGSEGDVRFIVTEFIDGVTLRQQMKSKQVKHGEVVEIGIQAASALAAAHAAGIVHRDIKPENIMLRRDRLVKVLDFGLAKLTERAGRQQAIDSEAATRTMVNTEPGKIMGTVHYMSPEQARGVEVDVRTDIWSLGVVLYEMVAGRAPFEGETPTDVIISLIEREPQALSTYAKDVPVELEWIITKALTKDREDRYQTAREMLTDLRRLMKRMDTAPEMERSVSPDTNVERTIKQSAHQASDPRQTLAMVGGQSVSTMSAGAARPTSSAEYLATEIKRHKRAATIIVALLAIAACAVVFATYRFSTKSGTPSEPIKIAKLTTHGNASSVVAISPDGKYVVYAAREGAQQSLWVRQVATSSNVQIIPPAEVEYWGLTFSPDGNYINYVKREKTASALYQMPVLGGTTKKLLANADGAISYSPDGKQFAFVRGNYPNLGESALMIANADGTGERILASRQKPETFPWWWRQVPAWSPDGKTIACIAGGATTGSSPMSIVEVQVANGALKTITTQEWYDIRQVAWLRDKSAFLILAADQASSFHAQQIWRISYEDGEARRVTTDFTDYVGISLTADSSALAAVQTNRISNIWVAPGVDSSRAVQIKSGGHNYEGADGLAWTPDGKIVYYSRASGMDDIWMMNGDGTGQKQLTVDAGANYDPKVTPDGRYIVFASERNDNQNIWRMDMDGGNPKQLTSGNSDIDPACSPDSRWVIYSSDSSGKRSLWKVSIDGGRAVQLTEQAAESPQISPDGKLIACQYREAANTPWMYAIIPSEGGQPVKVFDPPAGTDDFRWSPDGRMLTYDDTRNGVTNIWAFPLDGSPPKQLTDFNTEHIFNYEWSRDGTQLVMARGSRTSDVVMISNFR